MRGLGLNGGVHSNEHPVSQSALPQGDRAVSSQVNVIETERQNIIQQLDQASAVVSTLKAKLNSLASVNRLPPEVIAEIFSILRDMEPPGHYLDRELGSTREKKKILYVKRLGWMLVMQVCTDWRSVAIQTPTLWKHVTWSVGYYWARRMLSYSKLIPVSIRMENEQDADINEDDPELISRHLSHIDSLHLSMYDSSWMGVILRWADKPAPLLETLSLEVKASSYRTYRITRTPSGVTTAPNNLFACHTPKLREVHLLDVFIPWTSPLFNGLRSLDFSLPFRISHRSWAPTLTQFLDAIENMPDLEDLTIQGSLPTYLDPETHPLFPSSNTRRARLVQLATLELGGNPLDVALTLSRLSLPSEVDLHLTIVPNVEDEDIEEVRQLFTVLSKHIDPSGRMPINVDELNVFKVCGFEIGAYPGRSCGRVSLQFEDDNNTAEVMENYFGILPFRPISHVNMTELGWDRWDWQQICGQPDGNAPSITSLTFVEQFAPGEFCAFLCSANIVLPEVDAASQPVTAALLPLPALSSLTFERSDFTDECRHSLMSAMQIRKKIGRPLEWLTLTSCLLPNNDGWLKTLKSVVQKLEVE